MDEPRYRGSRLGSGERSGNIGEERLVDHRLGRFHWIWLRMPPKTPIWKSIGRSRNRSRLLPWHSKKKRENRGNNMARESSGLTLKEKREEGRKLVEEMIILIAGERRSEIFQTQFLRRQDLDWRQPLSKMGRSRGSHRQPACVPFFPFLPYPPHLPPSPRLRPLSPHPLSLISILICSSIIRFSSPFLSLPF